ncbi:MAG: anaerobic carbon-monoxide dehydrogenase catalytic subunit [Caldiserica bacterium]|nr:anaerobic carbon-monoxide dehydrogenase catalytic subunit [Caldisericota bacterium]
MLKYKYSILNAECPDKEDVKRVSPCPLVKDIVDKIEMEGGETVWDRFMAQQPQCPYGLRGICCQRCLWGPCRIISKKGFGGREKKVLRGVCGADMNVIVVGNLVRALAAGCAAHCRHTQEVAEAIVAAARGEANFTLLGSERIKEMAERLSLDKSKDEKALAKEIAEIMLQDFGRWDEHPLKLLFAYAPEERIEKWKALDILPRSAMWEVFESLHKTGLGGNSDWMDMIKQDFRTALAYCYSGLFGSSLGTEILFGIPAPKEVQVDYSMLTKDRVNILLHGHSPVMAEKVVEISHHPEIKEAARKAGAEGIQLGGLCCTGLELLYRHGVPPFTNIMGAELIIGTGAIDAVVVDMQCFIPGVKFIADCYGTAIITTSHSNRIPGAVHLPYEPGKEEEMARKVLLTAIEAFQKRKEKKIEIKVNPLRKNLKVGWTPESIIKQFGGVENIVKEMEKGNIKGIAAVVGCNTPKVPYENNHVVIVRKLVEYGVLVLSTGCSSYALINQGFCGLEAKEISSSGLEEVCERYGIPPVLTVGACVDNARILRLFFEISRGSGIPLHRLPFIFSGPEPGNEKTVGQGIVFLLHGISVHQGFPGPIPVPIAVPTEGARFIDDYERGGNDVMDFFAENVYDWIQAKVYGEPYPELAGKLIQMHIRRQRKNLGWS